jgi:hypothetical protein
MNELLSPFLTKNTSPLPSRPIQVTIPEILLVILGLLVILSDN